MYNLRILENPRLEIMGNGLSGSCGAVSAKLHTDANLRFQWGGTLRSVITGIWRRKAASHWKQNKEKCIVYYNALPAKCKIMYLSGQGMIAPYELLKLLILRAMCFMSIILSPV